MEKSLGKKINKKEVILISIILILGLFLRLYKITQLPSGLCSNEALIGFRALSLVQTGKDETGRNRPLIFTSFKDYQLPAATYYLVPFVKVFGLSEYSVRIPFAFLGGISVLFFYLFVKNIFPGNIKVILWSSLFFAINPWGVFLSRTASGEVIGLSLIIIGTYFIVKSKNISSTLLGSIFLAISCYSTKSSWIFLPIFLCFLILFLKHTPLSISRKNIVISLFTILIISFPIIYSYFRLPAVKQSFLENDFNIFSDVGIINGVNQMRGNEILFGNQLLGKLFYNKTIYVSKLAENLLRHLTPRFFFASGDQNPLHGFSNFGPIFSILLPIVVIGIIFMIKKENKHFILFSLILIAAVFPSVFTSRGPDQLRFLFSFPVVMIFAGYGMTYLSKKLIYIFILLLLFNVLFISYDVIFKEPKRTGKIWGNSIGNINFSYLEKYDRVYFTDAFNPDPGPQILFYSKLSPTIYLEQFSPKIFAYHNWINKIGKIQIGQPEKLNSIPKEKTLLIISPEEEKKIISFYIDPLNENKQKIQYCYQRLKEGSAFYKNKTAKDYILSSLGYGSCQLN